MQEKLIHYYRSQGVTFTIPEEWGGHENLQLTVNLYPLPESEGQYIGEVVARFGMAKVLGAVCNFELNAGDQDPAKAAIDFLADHQPLFEGIACYMGFLVNITQDSGGDSANEYATTSKYLS